ncbi:MAG: hypothetical protein M3365_11720 [Gemmatimonadota bacterium]|nr:hypothetical protein [Gemmatimonadota bacterium]
MEEVWLTFTHGLTGLVIPIGLGAIALALALIVKSVGRVQAKSTALERVCVTLCGFLGLIGAITVVMNVIRQTPGSNPLFPLFLGFVLLLSAPALMWRSRWRLPAEGLATISLAAVSILSGFSIGWVFVPLVGAMMWVCIQHLRAREIPV